MPAFLWSYLLIVLLAQPKPATGLTGIQIYDLLGRDTGTRQFQAFDQRMGRHKVQPGELGQDLIYAGVELSLGYDSSVAQIRIYPAKFQGELPFGLKSQMTYDELLAYFPKLSEPGEYQTMYHDAESRTSIDLARNGKIRRIYFSRPDGYCTTHDVHFKEMGKDPSLRMEGESEAGYLARMRRDEVALLASLGRNSEFLENMQAFYDLLDSQQPWSPMPPHLLGAYNVQHSAFPIQWGDGTAAAVEVPASEQESFPIGLENAEVQILMSLNVYDCSSKPPAAVKLLHHGNVYPIISAASLHVEIRAVQPAPSAGHKDKYKSGLKYNPAK
jgi:hypothetical protein